MTPRRIFAGVFLFSWSSLAYEIALTRFFAISLWYHFAFMVISIAMLGIGASGTVLSVKPNLKAASRIGLFGLLLGAGITLSYLAANAIPFDPVRLSWDRLQLLYIILYYLFLSVPFLFFGLSLSTAFSALSAQSGLLYASDLLGAGTGSLCLLIILHFAGPEYAVVITSSTALAGAFLLTKGKLRIMAAVLMGLNIFLSLNPDLISPRMSPYKGLPLALQYPGAEHLKTYYSSFSRIDLFKSPAARHAPGLSVRYLDTLPEQIGFSIDGGGISAITYPGDRKKMRFLAYLPAALPYEIGKRQKVLVLQPKGGLAVLLARHYGADEVFTVESDPLITTVLKDVYGKSAPETFQTNRREGLGRSWLRAWQTPFDLIDIPLTESTLSGAFGVQENYGFTVEAYREYLTHLKDSGILSIQSYILPPPRTELRHLSTLIAAMEELGMTEVSSRIIVIRSWGVVTILARKTPFTAREIAAVKDFCLQRRFDLVHLPGIQEKETNIYIRTLSNEYFSAFQQLLNPSTRKAFQQKYLFAVDPVRDENPFSHYHLKLKNIKEIYETMGRKWEFFIEEGYLLPVVFLQVLFLSSIVILFPLFFRKRLSGERIVPGARALTFRPLAYFASLGIGFMFVEVSLIQKMILPLENPPRAIAAILTILLISSGAGSLLSHHFPLIRKRVLILTLACTVAVLSLFLPHFSNSVSPYPISMKFLFVFLVFFPPGFLMGIPFPTGMRILGEDNPEMIPWAWAVNGCLSVLAPILAVLLAMATGYGTVLWCGAAAYLLSFFTFPVPSARHRSSGQN